MASLEPQPGKCGAPLTRKPGYFCDNRAGKNTEHLGFGSCGVHRGRTPSGDKHGKKLMATAECERYGAPIDSDPFMVLSGLLAAAWGHAVWFRQAANEHGAVGDDGRPSVWWVLYQQERAEALKVADTCARVGVNERITRVMEANAEVMMAFGTAMLKAAGHDPFSEEARSWLEAGLAALPEGEPA